jgi:hypothetical protein
MADVPLAIRRAVIYYASTPHDGGGGHRKSPASPQLPEAQAPDTMPRVAGDPDAGEADGWLICRRCALSSRQITPLHLCWHLAGAALINAECRCALTGGPESTFDDEFAG